MQKPAIFINVLLLGLTGVSGLFGQTAFNSSRGKTGSAGVNLHFIEGIEIVPSVSVAISSSASGIARVASIVDNKQDAGPIVNQGRGLSGSNIRDIEKCGSLQFKYALLMNREVESIANERFYSIIDEWYGTRYLYGGTTKNGIDCSSFCSKVYAGAFCINLPRTARDQYAATTKIPLSALREGDLVFFNTRGGVSHVGIYLGNDYFVHSSTHQGVTISKMTDSYYQPRFLGGGRMVQP
jgi:hypothetical protein